MIVKHNPRSGSNTERPNLAPEILIKDSWSNVEAIIDCGTNPRLIINTPDKKDFLNCELTKYDRSQSTLEVERRFLVKEIPELTKDKLPYLMKKEILQVYVAFDEKLQQVLRLRSTVDQATRKTTYGITYKKGSGLVRDEVEFKIDPTAFQQALDHFKNRIISKDRFIVPIDAKPYEFDVFKDSLSGLYIIEKEFPSEKDSRLGKIPAWSGVKEITNDSRYNNAHLAVFGLPVDLSNQSIKEPKA